MEYKSQLILDHERDNNQFVSVIIPMYNAEANLATCLQSVKDQQYPQSKIEIIVIDDGSTDQSINIASRFNAKVVRQEHRGAGTARNRGIKEASGSIIAFLDADDRANISWLKEMLPYLHEDKVAAVGCNHDLWNKKNDFVKIMWLERNLRLIRSPEKVDHLGTSGCLYKKSIIDSIGGFDCSLLEAEDMDLAFRVKKQGWILSLVKKSFITVQYPDSWTKYFHDQLKKVAYLILFRWKSRSTSDRIGNSYSGLTDYVQSLFLYLFLLCPLFGKVYYSIPITAGVIFLLLICLNIPFITFVYRMRQKINLSTFFPVILLFYLSLRAFSWSLALIYGGILVLKNCFQVPVSKAMETTKQ